MLYETLIYSANRLGEISDSVADIDHALRWGFGWERGPFETWDALGVKATADKMEAAGYTVPGWVREQIAAQGEGMRFYRPAKERASRATWVNSASTAASRRSRPTRARCRSTRSAPPAARWSATAARRSSISATASSASSSTPR